jgi:16S rRNA (cytosine1402-N4)-methyltransferase
VAVRLSTGGAAIMEPPVSHEPVLVERVTALLAWDGPGVLVDATVGAGGHAAALLARSGAPVHLVGFDRDARALELADRRLAAYRDRVTLVHDGYDRLAVHLEPVLAAHGPLVGILYDLGVSSMQLDDAGRGFSFRADAPLDMRMDPDGGGATAADLVNGADVGDLTHWLQAYGEERFARRIARAIVAARPLQTTRQLADVVTEAVPAPARGGGHPATRTFQALRIVVNRELDRFSASLPQALGLLAPPSPAGPAPATAGSRGRGGRVAVISYHSLEDRIAKRTLTAAATGCICPPDLPVCACGREPDVRLLTRGAERPDDVEVARNPRARSARLRAAERIAPADPPHSED